jgi:Niemann-Pick C1 protein
VLFCSFRGRKATTIAGTEPNEGLLYKAFKFVYAPFLFKFSVRVSVLVVFFGWLCLSLSVLDKVDVGLDQELSMPEDSFVLTYFRAMFNYLSVGPPVYFVLKSSNFDYEDYRSQDLIRAGSNPSSLVSQIFAASKAPNYTYIAKPTASWIDDFIDWAGNGNCCKHKINEPNTFCPNTGSSRNCSSCDILLDQDRLTPTDFEHYLSFFLRDNPNEDCPKGGHAAYGQAVQYVTNSSTKYSTPTTSYFMTYHTILKTSGDYTEALREARNIAKNITDTLNEGLETPKHEVFAYSIFYVFYEQYLTMWGDTVKSLGISIVAIFLVVFVLTGFNLEAAVVVLITISMIVIDLGGLMYYWNISLNAVSLVNLVMVSRNYLKVWLGA